MKSDSLNDRFMHTSHENLMLYIPDSCPDSARTRNNITLVRPPLCLGDAAQNWAEISTSNVALLKLQIPDSNLSLFFKKYLFQYRI